MSHVSKVGGNTAACGGSPTLAGRNIIASEADKSTSPRCKVSTGKPLENPCNGGKGFDPRLALLKTLDFSRVFLFYVVFHVASSSVL